MSQIYKNNSGSGPIAMETYFQAYLTANQTVPGSNTTTTIIFDTTTTNVGSAYNTSNGVFTAPATGFYAFSTTIFFNNLQSLLLGTEVILSYTGNMQSLRIVQDDQISQTQSNASLNSASWSMPMSAGDTIQIQPFADGTGNYTIAGGAMSNVPFSTSSTFSGYRVA